MEKPVHFTRAKVMKKKYEKNVCNLTLSTNAELIPTPFPHILCIPPRTKSGHQRHYGKSEISQDNVAQDCSCRQQIFSHRLTWNKKFITVQKQNLEPSSRRSRNVFAPGKPFIILKPYHYRAVLFIYY